MLVWLVGLMAVAAAFADRLEPLPPEQAFQFNAHREGNTAVVTYDMPSGVYLYRDKMRLTVALSSVSLRDIRLPPGQAHDDMFFGRTTVYYGQLTIRAEIIGSGEVPLVVLSQGCDEQVGICYPPMENIVTLAAASGGAEGVEYKPAGSSDEASDLAAGIRENSILWTIAIFFLLGVGLSLTPCVLPMLPVLLSVVGGGKQTTRRQLILLTAAYIGGVVATFTAIGVLAGASGQLLTVFLQKPAVLVAMAALFVLLALSLFGAYDLQLPAIVRNKLATIGGGGGMAGAAIMGGISAVVVSPCVAAPLVGALLYIAQTGDKVIGGAALASLALGMSVLLAVAGIVGAGVLPRAGEWMNDIKRFFGVPLLLLAVWVVSPLLPIPAQMLVYGMLLLFGGMLARPFQPANGAIAAAAKATAVAAILWGLVLLAGVAIGSRDLLTPLSPLAVSSSEALEAKESVGFMSVQTEAELDGIRATTHRPLMVEFYADWCVSCKEIERFVFSDVRVIRRLRDVSLLRIDVTDNTPAQQKLLKRFGLFGPPAILFFDQKGELVDGVRVIGYQNADKFLQTLAAAGM